MTSGSLELMKAQVLAALSSCQVVGVTQEDTSRIGKCKGAPIRSGVSSELVTDLLPASPGRLIKNCKAEVLSKAEWIMHLEQARRYHPCTCTRYNGTTLVPAQSATVSFPGVISV